MKNSKRAKLSYDKVLSSISFSENIKLCIKDKNEERKTEVKNYKENKKAILILKKNL